MTKEAVIEEYSINKSYKPTFLAIGLSFAALASYFLLYVGNNYRYNRTVFDKNMIVNKEDYNHSKESVERDFQEIISKLDEKEPFFKNIVNTPWIGMSFDKDDIKGSLENITSSRDYISSKALYTPFSDDKIYGIDDILSSFPKDFSSLVAKLNDESIDTYLLLSTSNLKLESTENAKESFIDIIKPIASFIDDYNNKSGKNLIKGVVLYDQKHSNLDKQESLNDYCKLGYSAKVEIVTEIRYNSQKRTNEIFDPQKLLLISSYRCFD
jgi:hypothetical protein